VEDVGHHFACREEVVGVERVDDTLFGHTEVAGVRDVGEHEESHVVRMNGSIAIYHIEGLVVVDKGLAHEVDLFCKRLTRAVAKHEVVKQRKGACEIAII
jgi:hypothetical protein